MHSSRTQVNSTMYTVLVLSQEQLMESYNSFLLLTLVSSSSLKGTLTHSLMSKAFFQDF